MLVNAKEALNFGPGLHFSFCSYDALPWPHRVNTFLPWLRIGKQYELKHNLLQIKLKMVLSKSKLSCVFKVFVSSVLHQAWPSSPKIGQGMSFFTMQTEIINDCFI